MANSHPTAQIPVPRFLGELSASIKIDRSAKNIFSQKSSAPGQGRDGGEGAGKHRAAKLKHSRMRARQWAREQRARKKPGVAAELNRKSIQPEAICVAWSV